MIDKCINNLEFIFFVNVMGDNNIKEYYYMECYCEAY